MDIIERISAIAKMAGAIEDHAVYDQLGDLRIAAYELKTELLSFKEENRKLKEKLLDKEQAEFKDQCYYFHGDGPYCPKCYDVDGLKVHLLDYDNGWGKKFYRCPQCKLDVFKEAYPLPNHTYSSEPLWENNHNT